MLAFYSHITSGIRYLQQCIRFNIKGEKMYFPLIERRIAARDRRSHSTDRRQTQNSYSSVNNKRNKIVRRYGKDRRVLVLDRETLLYASILNKDQKPEDKKSKTISFCSAILIPLTIALSSIGTTIFINKIQKESADKISSKQMESASLIAKQQKESAELIAKGQQENAQKIADANIKNSKTIADAQMETQHLQHLVTIFSSIISPEKKEDKRQSVINQRIRSLAVYGDEALPFLLQIRQHFPKPDDDTSTNTNSYLAAKETIETIIGYSQLDLSGQIVTGSSDTPINLRHKIYENYNLDNSYFTNVNLYKANFSGSSLQNSSFTSADLQETNFMNANLKNVKFVDSNLSKTDFRHAYLVGVTFSPDCKNIQYAKFSLNTLLKAESVLFETFDADMYALLLITHEKKLERINNEEKNKLDAVYTKSNTNNFRELQEKLNILRNKGLAGIKDKPIDTHKLSMNTI